MKLVIRLLLMSFACWTMVAATHATAKSKKVTATNKKKSAASVKSSAHAARGSKSTARKAGARTVRASGKAGRRLRGKTRIAVAPPVATWRRGQMEPSPDRYREIQQALASKGYLKSEPTGSWDGDSQAALRRFQADQKLDQSGTITAKSLIALGLGPAKQP